MAVIEALEPPYLDRIPSLTVIEGVAPVASVPEDTACSLGVEVISVDKVGRTRKFDHGTTERFIYTLGRQSDNSEPESFQVEVDASQPKKQKFDIGLNSGTMWLTGLDGYNEGWGEYGTEKGMAVAVTSAEVGSVRRALSQIGRVSLVNDAITQFVVHDDLAKKGRFKERELLGIGYSREVVINQIMCALAPEYGFRMPYTESIDGGLLSDVSWSDIDIKAVPRVLGREIAALANGVRKTPLRRLRKLARTFLLSPQGLAQGVGTGLALGSGEAQSIITDVPKDQVGNMVFCTDSVFNRYQEWIEIFEAHPNMRIALEEGCHMTASNPSWQKRAVGHVALVQKSLHDGLAPQEVSLEAINAKVAKKMKDGRF